SAGSWIVWESMHVRIEIYRGIDATERLTEPAFVEQWLALYRVCPWATPFQHPAFVNTWYRCYRKQARPVVAAGFNDGEIVGLLLLAEQDGTLVGAGSSQAEYQVWLSLPTASEHFASRAVSATLAAVPGLPLCLKYVPSDAPAVHVTEAAELVGVTEV